jgi:hypothetical protein
MAIPSKGRRKEDEVDLCSIYRTLAAERVGRGDGDGDGVFLEFPSKLHGDPDTSYVAKAGALIWQVLGSEGAKC